MAVYIGVDLHVRTETVCWMNTADGEIHQHTVDHSRDALRAFYAQFPAPAVVGIESSGYALWFHQLIEQAGHRLLVGDAYAIRQFARRRQKNDRRDAELLLDLLRRDEFPVVHRPAPPSQDTLALLDRKSTRLNSSHVRISYAVFCLKKKKQVQPRTWQ